MDTRSNAPLRAEQSKTNSRSRRTAAVIATTVGAAAVATGTLAVPADAAVHHSVWDRVAHCESSNRWHINTGNGFYGGLQFTASTWRAYDGHKYARQANLATRAEQIQVARRVLASQGPHAWPVCGPRAGLTRQSGDATHAPLPNNASQPVHRVAAKHRYHGKHRANDAYRHERTYRVHSGDTLSGIAQRLHVHGGWKAIYRANRNHLHNPNMLRVGQQLRIPR
jgi:nucleoid-associated protein YgaU